MKRLCGYLTLLLGGVLLNSPTAEAGVVVDLFPSQTEITLTGSPQSFSIDVRIAADQGTQSFKAYGLPVDLGPPAGTDTPPGWTVTSISALFDFPVSNFFQSNANPAEGDLLAEGGTLSTNASDAVELTTAPLALFRFTVELDAQAVPGDYTASIVNQALLSLIDANNNEIPVTEGSFRSATISLVPEPNGLLAALSFMLTLVLRRRRQQLCPCLVSANRND